MKTVKNVRIGSLLQAGRAAQGHSYRICQLEEHLF